MLKRIPQDTPVNLFVSKREFMQRFTQAERIAIRKSTDDVVIDIHADMVAASQIDLQLKAVTDALDYLTGQGILAPGRKADILGHAR